MVCIPEEQDSDGAVCCRMLVEGGFNKSSLNTPLFYSIATQAT